MPERGISRLYDGSVTKRRAPGSLESEVLQALWASPQALTARQLCDSFPKPAQPALTTMLTVLRRLETKVLVDRREASGGAQFSASKPESEQVAGAMSSLLRRVSDREAVLLRFAGSLDDEDTSTLRRALRGMD